MLYKPAETDTDEPSLGSLAVQALMNSGRYGEVPISAVEETIDGLVDSGVGNETARLIATRMLKEEKIQPDSNREPQIRVYEIPTELVRDSWC